MNIIVVTIIFIYNKMEHLLDKMYRMRFCLSTMENDTSKQKQSKCICVGYNHIACIFKSKGKDR